MKPLLPLFIGLIFFASCSTNDKPGKQEAINNQSVKQMAKPFSDKLLADTFRVVLSGEKPKDMLLKFTIISHAGEVIYTRNLQGKELLDAYKETVDLKKRASQVSFIRKEFDLFFEDENFLEPAVTETEEPDQFVPDKAFYAELRQSGLNGFTYRLGQENKVYIAWSSKENKVKIYYKCC